MRGHSGKTGYPPKILGVMSALLLVSLVLPAAAEAGGRRSIQVRRAAPSTLATIRRQSHSGRALPNHPAAPTVAGVRHVQALGARAPVAGQPLPPRQVLYAPTAPRSPVQRGMQHSLRRYRNQARSPQPSAIQALQRYRRTPGARHATGAPATVVQAPTARALQRYRHVPAARSQAAATRVTARQVAPLQQRPSMRTRSAVSQAQSRRALARLGGTTGHRSGLSQHPQRPLQGTGVTSPVDTRRRFGRVTSALGRGNLARARGRAPLSTLRGLADRRRNSHHIGRERHVQPSVPAGHPHRRPRGHGQHHRPAFGYEHAGVDWSWYWHRHHRPGLPVSRTIVIVQPYSPYVPYDPYDPYGTYPSPGYQDDPIQPEPDHRDDAYAEAEYGIPAPDAAPQGPDHFTRGAEAFHAGDYKAARGHWASAVLQDPDDGEAWMASVHVAFLLGQYKEAAIALAEAARLGAFPRGYRFDARQLFEDPKVFDTALARLHRIARTHPRDTNAWIVRAYFHVALGERDAARLAIHHVLLLRRADPTAPILNTALLPALEPEARTTR